MNGKARCHNKTNSEISAEIEFEAIHLLSMSIDSMLSVHQKIWWTLARHGCKRPSLHKQFLFGIIFWIFFLITDNIVNNGLSFRIDRTNLSVSHVIPTSEEVFVLFLDLNLTLRRYFLRNKFRFFPEIFCLPDLSHIHGQKTGDKSGFRDK